MRYEDVKRELVKNNESVKHFTKGFFESYKKAVLNVNKCNENEVNDYYMEGNIYKRHSFDEIYKSAFYNKNSCAYCNFLEIVCGAELI